MSSPFATNGYYDLPSGKLAAVVTYLEMTERPEPRPVSERPDLSLVPARERSLAQHRELFSAVGRDWLWFSRLIMPDDELRAILQHPRIETFEVHGNGRPLGILELGHRVEGEVELSFFGLVPAAVGGGAGRWLMDRAMDLAWATAPRRFWVHTCSFDHPDALAFYQRSGFRPYKRAVEIADDPRITGHLPASAGGRTPLIR